MELKTVVDLKRKVHPEKMCRYVDENRHTQFKDFDIIDLVPFAHHVTYSNTKLLLNGGDIKQAIDSVKKIYNEKDLEKDCYKYLASLGSPGLAYLEIAAYFASKEIKSEYYRRSWCGSAHDSRRQFRELARSKPAISQSLWQGDTELLGAPAATINSLEQWLQGCLFAGILATNRRTQELLARRFNETETAQLLMAPLLNEDFWMRMYICAALAKVLSNAKEGPIDTLRTILGPNVWNSIGSSKMKSQVGQVADCLHISFQGDSVDAVLEFPLGFQDGTHALSQVFGVRAGVRADGESAHLPV